MEYFDFLERVHSIILSKFLRAILHELNSINAPEIDGYYFQVSVKKILGEMSLKEKLFEKDLEIQVKFLETKLQTLLQHKDEVSTKLETKGKRRVKYFLGFLTAQIALLQYGTYVVFSWDIIEPLTCLLGVLDLIIAYAFWLYSHKEYSFEELKTHYIARRVNYYMKNLYVDLLTQKQNYEEEIKVIEKLLKITTMQRDTFKDDWENLRTFFLGDTK